MDQRRVAQAERHVRAGAALVERQRELVARLHRNGYDAALAQEILSLFEDLQASHLGTLDLVLEKIGAPEDWE